MCRVRNQLVKRCNFRAIHCSRNRWTEPYNVGRINIQSYTMEKKMSIGSRRMCRVRNQLVKRCICMSTFFVTYTQSHMLLDTISWNSIEDDTMVSFSWHYWLHNQSIHSNYYHIYYRKKIESWRTLLKCAIISSNDSSFVSNLQKALSLSEFLWCLYFVGCISMHVCIYIYICVCVYVYMYAYTCTQIIKRLIFHFGPVVGTLVFRIFITCILCDVYVCM